MDETGIRLDPVLRKCWMKRGEQKQVPLPQKPVQPIHLFGGYNWHDNALCWMFAERRNSEAFVIWLEQLMVKTYPTQTVVLLLDNASFHKSSVAQAAISLFEHRLLVLFLPPYAPQLNPIERYWNHLKTQVCGNRLFDSLDLLKLHIQKQLLVQNTPAHPDRFTLCK